MSEREMKFRFWGAVIAVLALCAVCVIGAQSQQPQTRHVRFMSDARHNQIAGSFPRTTDPKLNALFSSPNLVLFTDQEVPHAYQEWNGPSRGVLRAPPFPFPWFSTAGLERTTNDDVIKFVVFPAQGEIKHWRQRMDGDDHPVGSFRWLYPDDTTFGELLYVKHGNLQVVFEVRTRTFKDEHWTAAVYRPFPRKEDLDERLALDGLALPEVTLSRKRLTAASASSERVADMGKRFGFDHVLPRIPNATRLLAETPFRSALGKSWFADEVTGLTTFAPTANDEQNIVPRNYQGGYFPTDSKSCMDCHTTTMKTWRSVGVNTPGRVLGDHQVLSFHIFEKEDVTEQGNRNPRFRRELVQAGLIRP